MDKYIGKRLDGRYEIKEIIGLGGMAVVYKAYDNIEDRIVAVKILKEEYAGNEEFLRRFKNESKAVALLSHPNIVKVFDVSFGDLIQYIVMEYIDGITLKEYIEQQGSLSWKETVHFTIQILRGLQHAHDKGIVHRDVKPQNIMLLPDRTIKMADFGIARFARNEHQTMTDKAIGSVHYISPEQAKGEFTDEKADIYSVGIIMYEMLTGQVPFTSKSAVSVAIMQLQNDPKKPTELNSDIPEGLEDITMHAMQKVPEDRYKTAAEMLHDLEEFKRSPGMRFEYNYFVDDSPTRFVGGKGIVNEAEEIDEDEDEDDRSPILPILAGVATTLVIALVALLVMFGPALFGNTGDEIRVPNFIGLTYEEIRTSDDYDDFVFETNEDYNSQYPSGVIYAQDPGEGATRKKNNGQVTLWISLGPKVLKIPNLYGLPINSAINEIVKSGFSIYETQYVEDPSVPAGCVIKTEPAGGEEVDPMTKITIYQSGGASDALVQVPMLVGLTEVEAKRALESAGFTIGNVTIEYNHAAEAGYVVNQSLPVGEEYERNTPVDIVVSNGLYKYSHTVNVNINKDVFFPAGKENMQYILNVYEKVIGSDDSTLVKRGTVTIDSSKTTLSHTVTTEGTKASIGSVSVKVTVIPVGVDNAVEETYYTCIVSTESKVVNGEQYFEILKPDVEDVSSIPANDDTSSYPDIDNIASEPKEEIDGKPSDESVVSYVQ